MEQRLKITTYLASAIEIVAGNSTAQDWKIKVKKELISPLIGIYDPIEQETHKTGKPSGEMCTYLSNTKRGGRWKEFHQGMNNIWWGVTEPKLGNKIRMLQSFRERALIDGNYRTEMKWWGDYEAVARSSFIIAYIEKNVKTVGTIYELHTCYLMDIPVFLVMPDQTKTEANSTLVQISQNFYPEIGELGKIFYSVDDCIEYIKKEYLLS